jgi:EmrB/QacA subfamily drug resistance transporter
MKSIDRKAWILIAIGSGSFMSALDASVVNTILPIVREAFQSNVATIQWVVTIYLLVLSGLLLTFGRLGDLRGHKSVYIWGYVVFVMSSALCGAAWSPEALIFFRGLQGIGGAILAANSAAIISRNIPPAERGRAFGLVSMLTYLGLTVGPSLGGWLAHAFSWRVIFYINVPIGALALTLGWIFIPGETSAATGKKFDITGAILFVAGLAALMLGLNKGSEWGWASPAVLGLLVGAVVLLAAFIQVERRSLDPMLDLSLFKVPLFSMTTISAILNYICIYSITFLMPFYLIQGRGMNTAEAGLLLTIQPILMAITAPISGALSDRIGSRLPGMVGMALLGIGLFLLSRLGPDSSLWLVGLGMGIAGIGTGAFISPNTSALMGSAPRTQQGVASGVLGTARNLGMVLGIGLAGAILTTQLARNTPDAIYNGVGLGFLIAAGVAVLGIISSAIKEEVKSPQSGK